MLVAAPLFMVVVVKYQLVGAVKVAVDQLSDEMVRILQLRVQVVEVVLDLVVLMVAVPGVALLVRMVRVQGEEKEVARLKLLVVPVLWQIQQEQNIKVQYPAEMMEVEVVPEVEVGMVVVEEPIQTILMVVGAGVLVGLNFLWA
jgi:hypothetical protein